MDENSLDDVWKINDGEMSHTEGKQTFLFLISIFVCYPQNEINNIYMGGSV